MYVCYYGLMSLSTIIIFAYCAFMEAMFVMGCMRIFSMLAQEHWLSPIVYFVQLFTYGYGGYMLFLKLRKYRNRDPKTDSMTAEEAAEEDGGKVKKENKNKNKNKSQNEDDEEQTPRPA